MRRRDDVERAFWLADLTCFYLLYVYLCILSAPAFLFSTEPKSLHLSFIPFLLTLPSSLTRPYPAFLFQLTSIQVADLSNYSTSIHFPRPSILYKLYQWVCGFKMDEHKKWSYKILSTLGVLLHLVFVDLARDFIRWINLKPKVISPSLSLMRMKKISIFLNDSAIYFMWQKLLAQAWDFRFFADKITPYSLS